MTKEKTGSIDRIKRALKDTVEQIDHLSTSLSKNTEQNIHASIELVSVNSSLLKQIQGIIPNICSFTKQELLKDKLTDIRDIQEMNNLKTTDLPQSLSHRSAEKVKRGGIQYLLKNAYHVAQRLTPIQQSRLKRIRSISVDKKGEKEPDSRWPQATVHSRSTNDLHQGLSSITVSRSKSQTSFEEVGKLARKLVNSLPSQAQCLISGLLSGENLFQGKKDQTESLPVIRRLPQAAHKSQVKVKVSGVAPL